MEVPGPMYREIISRALSGAEDTYMSANYRLWLRADGRMDIEGLLAEFAALWPECAVVLASPEYRAAAPHYVLLEYLRLFLSYAKSIQGMYGVYSRDRVQFLIYKPGSGGGPPVPGEAIELTVWRARCGNATKSGLEMIDESLSRLGLDAGTLVIFDRRPRIVHRRPRAEITKTRTSGGRAVTLLRA
jgi:hypothetical protein